jgi:hypothetical protein
MGIGIVMISFGVCLAAVLFARATMFASNSYLWFLILCALISSAWVLGLAGGAIARFQSSQLERLLAKNRN